MPPRATHHLGLLLLAAVFSGAGCDSTSSPTAGATGAAASSSQPATRVAIQAVDGAFEPAVVHLKQGVPGVLEFTRVVDSECVNAVRMPWMKEAIDLPLNEKVEIPVDTSKAGTFTYGCWMNMVFGRVTVDPP